MFSQPPRARAAGGPVPDSLWLQTTLFLSSLCLKAYEATLALLALDLAIFFFFGFLLFQSSYSVLSV